MDFDRALEHCGNFGRFQIAVMLLFGYTNVLSSFHLFAQTLVTFTPEHWCYHEKLQNATAAQMRHVYADVAQPACTRLDDIVNGSAVVASPAAKCQQWIFEYEHGGYESITTELEWVCDDAFQSAVGQSMFYIGSVLGTIFFGYLSDRYGRLPILLISTLTGATGDFITSFVHTLPTFAVGRFTSGLSTDTVFYLMYIMVFEYLGPQKRTFGLNIITAFFYCCGIAVAPWLAIWVRTWRRYLLVASLPALGVLLYPLVLCESAQWLITKENYEGAVRSLRRVARVNGRHVEESVFEQFVAHYKSKRLKQQQLIEGREDTFFSMFRTPQLRKVVILLFLKSMIVTLSFEIISRNMEGLGTSPFLLFSLTGFAYVPAGLTIILLQNVIGRKGMACAGLLGGGLITAITGFLIAFLDPAANAVLLAVMVGLGRYGAIVAYDAEAQYGAEIMPTSVRGQGVSITHVVGYGFSFVGAYVIYLGRFYKPAPSIIISVLMIVGAALCLLLPETLNRKLPETLSDGEKFGVEQKWYYFPCLCGSNAAQDHTATERTRNC